MNERIVRVRISVWPGSGNPLIFFPISTDNPVPAYISANEALTVLLSPLSVGPGGHVGRAAPEEPTVMEQLQHGSTRLGQPGALLPARHLHAAATVAVT